MGTCAECASECRAVPREQTQVTARSRPRPSAPQHRSDVQAGDAEFKVADLIQQFLLGIVLQRAVTNDR